MASAVNDYAVQNLKTMNYWNDQEFIDVMFFLFKKFWHPAWKTPSRLEDIMSLTCHSGICSKIVHVAKREVCCWCSLENHFGLKKNIFNIGTFVSHISDGLPGHMLFRHCHNGNLVFHIADSSLWTTAASNPFLEPMNLHRRSIKLLSNWRPLCCGWNTVLYSSKPGCSEGG